MPRSILEARGIPLLTLGDVDSLLTSALAASGYDEVKYHRVPGGYAVLTRIERISDDGTPDQVARWSTDIGPIRGFSLSQYIRALFTARSGYFRVLLFVVTSEPFCSSKELAHLTTIRDWSRSGLNVLPNEVRSAPYTDDHNVTVLVYEFEKVRASGTTDVTIPGRLTGQTHLEKSGVLAQLEGH